MMFSRGLVLTRNKSTHTLRRHLSLVGQVEFDCRRKKGKGGAGEDDGKIISIDNNVGLVLQEVEGGDDAVNDVEKAKPPVIHERTPKEIVKYLDEHIVAQSAAKESVAIALRNRWRRLQLSEDFRDEVCPSNILMIGPTGSGKTEIARRIAKLVNAPFVKVEATKFTEAGYVGKDVDSIIEDLYNNALRIVTSQREKQYSEMCQKAALELILDALERNKKFTETRRELRKKLNSGELDNIKIDCSSIMGGMMPKIPTCDKTFLKVITNLPDFMNSASDLGTGPIPISEAKKKLTEMELSKYCDNSTVTEEAIRLTENSGIVVVDEIDKVCKLSDHNHGDISNEGVQRDLLPLLDGSTVSVRGGAGQNTSIKTDHILFIACGAFHNCSPSDLVAELQGRLPIRVEVTHLTEKDMYKILTEPVASLIRQQTELLSTEGIELKFDDDAVLEIARVATEVNKNVENIGARRLRTIIERVMQDVSFYAPELAKNFKSKKKIDGFDGAKLYKLQASKKKGKRLPILRITKSIVQHKVSDMVKKTDFNKFIL